MGKKKFKARFSSIGVRALTKKIKRAPSLLSRSTGVGKKTSLARALRAPPAARSFDWSLGGVRDEDEIRGQESRNGAMPRKLNSVVRKVGTKQSGVYSRRVDKMSTSPRRSGGGAYRSARHEQNHS